MNEKQQQLAGQWGAVTQSAGAAIEWVEAVRGNSKRLNSEADSLVQELRRLRNKSRHLQRAAETPMTIGFFGISQAGKSVLISALGAGENGKFEARYGGRQVDFITHINPSGMGKESTGLVTRFTRQATPAADDAYPVEVRLFREIDLAKIFSNAWFNDFDQSKVDYRLDETRIERILSRFTERDNGPAQPGVDADDVISLMEYVQEAFNNAVKPLNNGYWHAAMQLAPRLNPRERAELFSLLWGELPELTQAYAEIAGSLRTLGNAEVAYVPLDALAREEEGRLQYSRDSIMSVDALLKLGSGDSKSVAARPMVDGKLGAAVQVQIPHLGALTRELVFPLMSTPREESVERVDLLDFPGYRGRYKAAGLAELSAEGSPVGQLLLRGKVAYLFENYTDAQAMNGLVMCSPEQSEVADIGPVLERWVQRTQGETPEIRGQHACGLFWAITKFDLRLQNMLGLQSDTQIAEGWANMVRGSLEERYSPLSFMGDWDGGSGASRPFRNTFVVRKPGAQNSFTTVRDGVEVLLEDKLAGLDKLRSRFLVDEMVQRRLRDAQAGWDAVLTPGDGGMSVLASAIDEIANIDFKLDRLQRQLDDELNTEHGVLAKLKRFFQSETGDDLSKKMQLAASLAQQLYAMRIWLPELQHALELSTEDLRELYQGGLFRTERQEQAVEVLEEEVAEINPFATFVQANEDNPFAATAPTPAVAAAGPSAVAEQPVFKTTDHLFAEAVFQKWVAHLRDFPARARLLATMQLNRDTAEHLVDEIITAAIRLKLPEQLEQAVLSHQDSGSKREHVAMRQVFRVQTVLRDFLAWLGYQHLPLKERPISPVNRQHLFANTTRLDATGLPDLGEKLLDTNEQHAGYWLAALKDLVEKNAGHMAGSDITVAQNRQLGHIIQHFAQA